MCPNLWVGGVDSRSTIVGPMTTNRRWLASTCRAPQTHARLAKLTAWKGTQTILKRRSRGVSRRFDKEVAAMTPTYQLVFNVGNQD